MRGDIKIGEVMVIVGGRKRYHDIFSVKNYGVVCPSLVTTNGSAALLADAVAAMIAEADTTAREIGQQYEVRVFVNDYEQTDMPGLRQALITAHRGAITTMEPVGQ
jgi:uncharacterized membrane protein